MGIALKMPMGIWRTHLTLWSWYQVDEQATASAMHAKLLGLRGVLRGRPEAMVIALAAEGDSDAAARTLLRGFLTSFKNMHPDPRMF
jgi:hypothetical protein